MREFIRKHEARILLILVIRGRRPADPGGQRRHGRNIDVGAGDRGRLRVPRTLVDLKPHPVAAARKSHLHERPKPWAGQLVPAFEYRRDRSLI